MQRESNDPDLKDPKRVSFVTGSALTRLHGRENGIAVLSEASFAVPTEDAGWYLCAFAANLNKASGVLVGISRLTPESGQAEGKVVKRYYLLSRPRAAGK